jgi:hypothetical protein
VIVETGEGLKKKWANVDSIGFDPLRFGDLPVPSDFILLPQPENHHGSSSLRTSYPLFRKVNIKEVFDLHGNKISMSELTLVIRIIIK